MSVTIDVSNDNKTATIKINGRFDFSLHSEFRKAYKDVKLDNGEYSIDLENTEYLDSSALGMLLLLKEHTESQSATIRLINFNDEIKEILSIESFYKLFTLG